MRSFRKLFSIFIYMGLMVLIATGGYASVADPVTLTVQSVTADASQSSTVAVNVTVSDPSAIAGAAFTVIYDTEDLTLADVQSTFFDTFANQFTAVNTGYSGATSVTIGDVTYDQPLVKGEEMMGQGTMIAGARVQAGEQTNTTLFTLIFDVTGAFNGSYQIRIVESKISNINAGYSSMGETIPMLVGATNDTDLSLAYPQIPVNFPDDGIAGVLTVIGSTSSDPITLDINQPFSVDKEQYVDIATGSEWDLWFHTDTNVLELNGMTLKAEAITSFSAWTAGALPDHSTGAVTSIDLDNVSNVVGSIFSIKINEEGIDCLYGLVQITGYTPGSSISFDFMPLGCWDYSMFDEGGEGQGCGGEYTISGRITDQATGNGVPGVWIDVYSDTVWCGGRYMTDQSGYYTATGMIDGSYRVSYWPPYDAVSGVPVYMEAYYCSTSETGTTRMWDNATPVNSAENPSNINMALSTGETIAGSIYADSDKTTLITYRVWVDAYSESTMCWSGAVAEGGVYTLTGLETANDYSVAVRPYYPDYSTTPEKDFMELWWNANGGSTNWDMAQPVSTDYTAVDFILKEGGTISGRVVDENYQGLAYVWVNAWSDEAMFGNGAQTDAEGYFTIKGLETEYTDAFGNTVPATYHVDVYDPNYAYQSVMDITPGTTGLMFVMSSGAGISGVVTDDAGNPISGVWVEAWSPSTGGWGGAYSGQNTDYSQNDTGRYYIEGLPPAEDYKVTIWPMNYPSQEYPETVSITAGDADAIHFVLSAGKHISGTVTDGSNPVSGVWIEAYSESTWFWANALTDEAGAYTITGLTEASDYRVSYWPDTMSGVKYLPAYYGGEAGTQSVWENASLVDASTASAEGIDLTLTTGAAITGRVTNGLIGVRDMWVDAWSQSTGNWCGTYTAEGGAYTLSGLAPSADYTVTVYPYNQAAVSQSDIEAPSVLDFDLSTATGKVISGQVTLSDGTPLANVWVNVWSSSTNSWGYDQTDESGNYIISGLASASDFELNIWTPDYGNYTQTGVSSSDAGNPIPVNIELSEGATISGTITGISGSGWNLWVDAWSETTYSWGGVEAAYDADTDTYTYTIKGLSDTVTDYRVSVNGFNYQNGQNIMTVFYTADGGTTIWENAELVSLTNGSLTDIDFTVDIGKSITGTISIEGVTAPNPLLEGIWVDAWSDSAMSWGGATTNASGAYTITGLAAASDYRISVWKEGYPSMYYSTSGSTPIWDNATLVDVTQGDRTGINIRLTKGGTISGTVTNSVGKALQNVWVDVYSPSQSFGMGAMTDINGRYEVTGLLKTANGVTINDYIVTAYPPAGTNYKMISKTGKMAGDVVNFKMTEGFTLYGKVLDPDGNPFTGGAWVDVWNDTFYGWAEVSTTDGTFSIKGLTDGTYQIYIWPYNGVYKQIELPNTAIISTTSSLLSPMLFNLNTGLSISGRVTDSSGNGIRDAYVDAWSPTAFSWGSAVTDSTGAYTITGLTDASDYQVSVWAAAYPYEYQTGVSAGATGVNFTLSNGGSISGSVSYKGVARAGVWVEAWSESTQSWAGSVTGADGSFTLTGLKEKTLNGVTVTDYQVTVYPENLAVMTRSGVSVGTTNLEFNLSDGNTISGTITDSANGNPLANVKVKIYNAGTNNDGIWINNVFTDASGNFEMKGLTGTGYNIRAQKDGYTAVWYVDDSSVSTDRADAAVVTSGTAITMQLTLAP